MHFSFFTVILKNRNIIQKIKRSKVIDYAALRHMLPFFFKENVLLTFRGLVSLKLLIKNLRISICVARIQRKKENKV